MTQPFVLFIADKFIEDFRSKKDRFPGGAERDDEALIESCPYPVKKSKWSELDEESIEKAIVLIVGNSGSASPKELNLLSKYGKHILFEHDLRICRWRGNFGAALSLHHRFRRECNCKQGAKNQFFEKALSVVYLTQLQKDQYERNPFYKSPQSSFILGSPVFDREFLDFVDSQPQNIRKKGTLIFSTKTKSKGTKASIERCIQSGWSYSKIENFTPREVWLAMAKAERFVFLPNGWESAGRMPLEAKLLGCETIINDKLGVAGEEIWKLVGKELRETIGKQCDNFWQIVDSVMDDFQA